MIGPMGSVRVMVAVKPVDFRKGADGLAALVRDEIRSDPFDGAIYVFRAKRADRVKLIWWDGTGVCLYAKRFERRKVPVAGAARRGDPADAGTAFGAPGGARLASRSRGAIGTDAARAELIAAGPKSPQSARNRLTNMVESRSWRPMFRLFPTIPRR